MLRPRLTSSTIAPDAEESRGGVDVIPIYCSILGLLVVALLVCVIVQQRKRRKQLLQQRKAELAQRNGSPSKDALSGLLKQPDAGYGHASRRPPHSVADSGVYMEPECRPGEHQLIMYTIHNT
jgi:hypothetical protein